MTSAHVVETSVASNSSSQDYSPSQDYIHPDDPPNNFVTSINIHSPGFRPFYTKRANIVSSSDNSKSKEENHVFTTLNTMNGYPKGFIKRHKDKKTEGKNDDSTSDWKGFAAIPYVRGVTERIQRILR